MTWVTSAQHTDQRLEFKYDPATNKTTVTTKTQKVSGQPLDGLHLKVVGSFGGKKVVPTEQIGLILLSVSKEEILSGEYKTLVLIVDGKKIIVGEMVVTFQEYDSICHMQGFYIRVGLAMLRKLTSAKKVEGRLGHKEFALKRDHQVAIKDFVNYFATAEPRR